MRVRGWHKQLSLYHLFVANTHFVMYGAETKPAYDPVDTILAYEVPPTKKKRKR